MVVVDLSQIELRTTGQASGDPVLLEAYAKEIDLHWDSAVHVISAALPPEHLWFTKWPCKCVGESHEPKCERFYQQRQAGKNWTNFPLVYEASAYKLHETFAKGGIPITMLQATMMFENINKRFARLQEYRKEVQAEVIRTEEVRTLFGWKRAFPGIKSLAESVRRYGRHEDKTMLAKLLRDAFATIPQGTAAQLFKGWSILCERDGLLDESHRLVLFVHDEKLAYCPEDEAAQWVAEIVERARQVPERVLEWLPGIEKTRFWPQVRDWQVPIVAEASWGANWVDQEHHLDRE